MSLNPIPVNPELNRYLVIHDHKYGRNFYWWEGSEIPIEEDVAAALDVEITDDPDRRDFIEILDLGEISLLEPAEDVVEGDVIEDNSEPIAMIRAKRFDQLFEK